MNVHDSERISGLLEQAGYVRAADDDDRRTWWCSTPARSGRTPTTGSTATSATCARSRTTHPGMQIAVGGCLAQKDRGEIVRRAPWVDVVFGTHNIGSLPVLLERARHNAAAEVEILESLEVFPSTLPTRRESTYAGWVSISVGCNNTCTFCIVPALRGKEKDRRPGDILAEVRALVAEGVLEVTLLGQNVNSYGVEFGDRLAFGKLLRACGDDRRAGAGPVHQPAPEGLHRRRDRRDGRDAERLPLAAHAAAVRLGRRCCEAMRRSYRAERYLGIIDKVRAAMPDAAITTDIIVGFPGETEADFERTLDVVRAGPVRPRVHLPVLEAPRHPGRDHGRPGAQGRSCRSATSG